MKIQTPVIVAEDGNEVFLADAREEIVTAEQYAEIAAAINAFHGYDGPVWEGMVAEIAEAVQEARAFCDDEDPWNAQRVLIDLLAKLRPAAEGDDG